VKDAAWGCDWVGTPVSFQRCLVFIIATANKEFTLTAGKFAPMSNSTLMNVRILNDPCWPTKRKDRQTAIVRVVPFKIVGRD
jgi:hypothetical protein